jgi:hypothetical protein
MGAGRVIVPGQLIHASVAFKHKDYRPRATFLGNNNPLDWASFVGQNIETSNLDWAAELRDQVEMDLFDASFTVEAIKELKAVWGAEDTRAHEQEHWLMRLSSIALSGELGANYAHTLQQTGLEAREPEISDAIAFFRKLEAKQPGVFNEDIAELLEHHSRTLTLLGRKQDAAVVSEEAVIRRRMLAVTNPPTLKKFEKLGDSLETLAASWRGTDGARALAVIDEALEFRRTIARECAPFFPLNTLNTCDFALSQTLADRGYILYDLAR